MNGEFKFDVLNDDDYYVCEDHKTSIDPPPLIKSPPQPYPY